MDTTPQKKNIIDRCFAFRDALPPSDRFLLALFGVVFLISSVWLLIAVNTTTLSSIPKEGGSIQEGIVGTPRFINPILAVSTADLDLTALIYAGILTRNTEGELVPNIAESVTVSEDGLTYTITLRENVFFHDSTRLTTDDVIFTIAHIQNPAIQSPLRASWEGVSTLKVDEREMHIVLPAVYAPFLENLTVGILPKHIWENASVEELPFSQYNSEPIGAGPYKIAKINRDRSGIPESYQLAPYKKYFNSVPKIQDIIINFYRTEEDLLEAFTNGKIESAGGLSTRALEALKNTAQPLVFHTAPLPRTFALFFNQNEQPLFRDSAVRNALSHTVDRDRLVREILGGNGVAISTPIPPGFGVPENTAGETNDLTALDEAREILRNGGWSIDEETGIWTKTTDDETRSLEFSISTVNTPLFEQIAQILKERWEELGVSVTIKQFEQSDLTQGVIRPRQYESLLFGTVVGRELDFYSFWHSSQRNDPGLNVALYANIVTDDLLTDARITTDSTERKKLFKAFSAEIEKEVPAIFLFVPTYTYITQPNVHGVSLNSIARGYERFSTVHEWYIEKESVWPMFTEEVNTDDLVPVEENEQESFEETKN